ncbi:MAG: putative zinc-binding protein [Pseudomonadota bacterium]
MNSDKLCCCGNDPTRLIFVCSGSSNVGQITHATAIKANQEGIAKMSCLAGVGAHLSGFVVSARDCNQLIVLDGCDQQCARKIFEHINITPGVYLELTQNGFVKEHGIAINESDVTNAFETLKKHLKGSQC